MARNLYIGKRTETLLSIQRLFQVIKDTLNVQKSKRHDK